MRFFIDMAAIMVLLWAVSSIEARAEDCRWIAATVASKHFGEKPGKHYNEANWGLGEENCLGTVLGMELRGVAGVYRNSNRIDSLYVGGSAALLRAGPFSAGVAALLVSGYEVEPIKAVFPVMAVEGARLGLNVSYFPPAGKNVAAIGFQVKWRWR